MTKKTIITIIFLFLIYFIFYSISYSYSVSQELEKSVFRLHIIANSDSTEDQELKLYVRDNLIEYLHQFSFQSKEDLINFLNTNQKEIESVIQKSITEKGFSYPFTLEISNSFFPKKEYNNIELPSGIYDGLRIKIGDSERKKLVVCLISTNVFNRLKYMQTTRRIKSCTRRIYKRRNLLYNFIK